jgi:hypothetical protein
MNHILSFGSAQAQYDNMLPFDDSRAEAAHEHACEEIENDRERLLDAVIDSGDEDGGVKLAEMYLVLRDASVVLRAIFDGKTFDEATASTDHLQAMRALLRAAENAEAFVSRVISVAAEESP